MPKDEHLKRKCPVCAVKMRSDHLRRHLQTHTRLLTEETPADWRSLPGRNLFVKVEPAVVGIRAEKILCGVCLDCAATSTYPRFIPPSDRIVSILDSHLCAPKRAPGAVRVPQPAATPTAAPATDSDSDSDSEPEETPMEQTWNRMRSRFFNRPKPRHIPGPEWGVLAQAIKDKMDTAVNDAMDDDTGVIDYGEAMEMFMVDLFNEWREAHQAMAVAAAGGASEPPAPPTTGFKVR